MSTYSIGRTGNIIEILRNKHFYVETEPHRFVTDASDICCRVGFAPRRIRTDLGNGQDFIFAEMDADHRYVKYVQNAGCCTLIVYND